MKEKRRSRGFTLTEMLASIAMLAILAGLLIPVSASMYRRFRLTEMDDFARQICVAAQNELTAMKASEGNGGSTTGQQSLESVLNSAATSGE